MLKYIDIHTHKTKPTKDVIQIQNLFPKQRSEIIESALYCMGIHPWYLEKLEQQFVELEESLQENANIIAIGEAGLDKSKGGDYDLQKEVFRRQIILSEKYKKPLILHSVRSHSEVLRIKKQMKPKMPWVLHGFEGNAEIGLQLINVGIYLSVGEAILKKKKLRNALPHFPLGKLFFETDESKFDIEMIYLEYSKIKNIPLQILCKEVVFSYNRLQENNI
jgi:TatD DNase family protein